MDEEHEVEVEAEDLLSEDGILEPDFHHYADLDVRTMLDRTFSKTYMP